MGILKGPIGVEAVVPFKPQVNVTTPKKAPGDSPREGVLVQNASVDDSLSATLLQEESCTQNLGIRADGEAVRAREAWGWKQMRGVSQERVQAQVHEVDLRSCEETSSSSVQQLGMAQDVPRRVVLKKAS